MRQCPILETAMPSINNLYHKHQRRSTFPSFSELQKLFLEISPLFARLFLVIDGLDEMSDRDDVVDFLECLSERDGDFKVLVASRAEFDLSRAFSYYCNVTIRPSDLNQDIRRFVEQAIRKLHLQPQEERDIVRELVAKADGM
jgi:hypothetical protein